MADGGALRRAAERASRRPFYLASSLLPYAHAERLDDAGLATRLGCELASLPALLLCRRPTGEGSVFRAGVEAIAERFNLDAPRLARLVRAADSLLALGHAAPAETGGFLAAARDRDSGGQPRADEPPDAAPPPADPRPDDA